MSGLLLRDAELGGSRRADVRVRDGIVARVAPSLERLPGEEVLDCGGAAVIPGLCDHHLHLHAMAAARSSVRCGPPDVRTAGELTETLRAAVPDENGWIRGTGYFESVAGDLDAIALDAMRPDVPVRVQHRSGALWVLNSAALAAVGAAGGTEPHPGIERDADGRATGRLWRADDWLRDRLGSRTLPSLAAVGADLLGYGITAVTDATPDLDAAAITSISDAMLRRELPPRVHLLGVPLGASIPRTQGLTVGPYKIVLADSGMLTYPELAGRITAAHEAGRAVAVHCVTLEALVLLLAALQDVGTRQGDRIEHGGIVPENVIDDLAHLGVRVVTQPGFLADRGDDFLRDLPAGEHADLYRCGSLLRAGVRVALSSDAPYGPPDPWAVLAAAVSRRTASGRVAGPAERVAYGDALAAYLGPPDDPGGPPCRVAVGSPADLVVFRVPFAALPGCPTPVRAVLTARRLAG
ncbi:MAG: amidohydrolase [Actinomycetia bacterium]|nr:amidohydrolase [Actinomycetes bacterium]